MQKAVSLSALTANDAEEDNKLENSKRNEEKKKRDILDM
jgi:hypothetical protein